MTVRSVLLLRILLLSYLFIVRGAGSQPVISCFGTGIKNAGKVRLVLHLALFLAKDYKLLQLFHQDVLIEAGWDGAGRGCLAGAVFAAAVILPKDFYHPLLNDSKQVTEEHRYELRPFIEKNALGYAVGIVHQEEIDEINILNASFKAMHLAVDQLTNKPGLLLIDGNRFNVYSGIEHKCVIKGDSIYASIAAASILAKTYRDDYMMRLHEEFPQYNWNTNKGYATLKHRKSIEEHGMSPYHRKSFTCLPSQLTLDL